MTSIKLSNGFTARAYRAMEQGHTQQAHDLLVQAAHYARLGRDMSKHAACVRAIRLVCEAMGVCPLFVVTEG